MTSLLRRGAVVVALCLLAIVYGCDAGHGFVKDDFVWIANSRVDSPGDIGRSCADLTFQRNTRISLPTC